MLSQRLIQQIRDCIRLVNRGNDKLQHVESTAESESALGWRRYKWVLIGLAVLLLGLLVGWAVVQVVDSTYRYHGTVIQSPEPARNFTLTGSDGQPVNLTDFQGKAVLLYFGYTFCPDVCPATMVELSKAKHLLGKDGDKFQVAMITVDPARDTPNKLQEYVSHFDPTFVGLSGSDDEIAEAATQFGIYYEKNEGSEASGYLIDHTASVVVIDPQGHLRLVYPFGTAGEDIAEDIRHLVR